MTDHDSEVSSRGPYRPRPIVASFVMTDHDSEFPTSVTAGRAIRVASFVMTDHDSEASGVMRYRLGAATGSPDNRS